MYFLTFLKQVDTKFVFKRKKINLTKNVLLPETTKQQLNE